MGEQNRDLWMQLVEKLNATNDITGTSKEVLADLCQYLKFGVGFIYETDYKGNYQLVTFHKTYSCELPDSIGHSALFPKEEMVSPSQKVVYFHSDSQKNQSEQRLSDLFHAKTMIVVPVQDQQNGIIALVGIMDRRGEERHRKEDIAFTSAVLTTLGTFVKMQIYQNRIQTTQKALESVLNHMGVDVYVNDFETHEILYLNESMAAPYGGVDEMTGKICWKSLYEGKTGECDFCPKPKLIDENGNPTKIYGWDYQRPFDGSWFRVLSAAFPWVDGRMAQVVSSVDITENKRNEEIIRRAAEYDMLTNLPNRSRLTADLDNTLTRLEQKQRDGYIIFFDLDGFKQVNDTLGHTVGDELLTKVGAYLYDSPLTRDHSYRYGGDEFVILWDDRVPGSLDEVIAYLRNGFSKMWQLESGEVRCGASIGISHYPLDGTLSSHLVRSADQAMYESKQVGTGTVHFYNKGNPVPY